MRRRGPLDYRRQHSGAASTRTGAAPDEQPPTRAAVEIDTGGETNEDLEERHAKRMAASRACGASGAPRCLETRGGAGLTTRGMTT